MVGVEVVPVHSLEQVEVKDVEIAGKAEGVHLGEGEK